MSSHDMQAEHVRNEHLAEVNELAHWTYLVAVLVGGTVLMIGLIAMLGTAPA
jgi:hypothetical protein